MGPDWIFSSYVLLRWIYKGNCTASKALGSKEIFELVQECLEKTILRSNRFSLPATLCHVHLCDRALITSLEAYCASGYLLAHHPTPVRVYKSVGS
jgi:hypothetical protein